MIDVPLREHIEALFAQHRLHVDQRFDDLDKALSGNHTHRDKVSWGAMISTLLTAGGLLLLVVINLN